MNDETEKYPTVGNPYAIDQRAIKEFSSWLPDNWLLRKQDPDFFVDYVVEIVENGEPTGKHFAAQIKGYEETANGPKPLSYAFQTKHLKYPFKSDDEMIRMHIRNNLEVGLNLRLIGETASKMPKAYGDAFRYIAYRDLNERLKMYLEIAEERIQPEACDPRFVATHA